MAAVIIAQATARRHATHVVRQTRIDSSWTLERVHSGCSDRHSRHSERHHGECPDGRTLSNADREHFQEHCVGFGSEEGMPLNEVEKFLTSRLGLAAHGQEVKTTMGELLKKHPAAENGEAQGLVTLDELAQVLQVGQVPTIERSALVRSIHRMTDRNDALMTLWLNLAYIVVFVILVVGHLCIYERQALESSLEAWVDGRDAKHMASRNIDDVGSGWGWLLGEEMGLENIFQVSDGAVSVVANSNILVADVLMGAKDRSGETQEVWLINSPEGQRYLQSTGRKGSNRTLADYLGAVKAAAMELQGRRLFASQDTEKLWLSFLTYNQMASMVAVTEALFHFKVSGQTDVWINAEALPLDPYSLVSAVIYIADAVYCMMVLLIAYSESRDLCAQLSLGLSEFLDYWTFWNFVDWMCILLGFLNISLWIRLCVAIADARAMISSMLGGKSLQHAIENGLEGGTGALLQGAMEESKYLVFLIHSMHWVMAFNTLSIVLRFFKAFTSNPRLKVVTDTFGHAMVDLSHFAITFGTIFLPFTIIGHVLFGVDIPQFRSIESSMNTGLQVMMGDFSWYVDQDDRFEAFGTLPSGMPMMVLFLWYFVFMFLIVLVLLNMLLAIIIEHYTDVVAELRNHHSEPLWTQVYDWFVFQRRTRRFIPLVQLRRGLENDSHPAHPEPEVTIESLMEAWPKMSAEQAKWLMHHVLNDDEVCAKEPEEDGPANVSEVFRLLEEQSAQIKDLMQSQRRLHESFASAQRVPHQEQLQACQRQAEDRAELAKVSHRLEELVESVAKLRRDQAGLARRVEDIRDIALVLQKPKDSPCPPRLTKDSCSSADSTHSPAPSPALSAAPSAAPSPLPPPWPGHSDSGSPECQAAKKCPERDKAECLESSRKCPEREKAREKRRQSGVGVKLKEKHKSTEKDRDKDHKRDHHHHEKDRGKIPKE